MLAYGLRRLAWAVAIVAPVLFCNAPGANAHFRLSVNIRLAHFEHIEGGLRVYLRLPLPLVVAGAPQAQRDAAGLIVGAPYTVAREENGQTVHVLDLARLRRDAAGLGRLVADGHSVRVAGVAVSAEVLAVRVHPAAAQPDFNTLAAARASLEGPVYPEGREAVYAGDSVVDVALFYATTGPSTRFTFGSSLAPGLPGEAQIANVLLDHVDGATHAYRARGTLAEPILVDSSPLSAAASFVQEGIRHILEGYDHVLFILCLTVGASALRRLVWRVTGFTLGHTVTLIGGFLGLAPGGAWFIPAIEAAIAASIIYAGVVALLRWEDRATIVVTAGIGLLHGFGFSFVLREVLRIDAPNLWVSLLSFNLGVEIGQLAIVTAVWALLLLVERGSRRAAVYGRHAVSLIAVGVAALWTGERLTGLAQMALG